MCEYTFNQQNHIKLIKSVSKDIYNVTNDFHFKKNFWTFYSSNILKLQKHNT